MRLLVLLLPIIFAVTTLQAQPKVLKTDELTYREHMTLMGKYPNPIAVANQGIEKKVREVLLIALASPKINNYVMLQIMVGKTGHVDYVFFDMPGFKATDSLIARMKDVFKKELTEYTVPDISSCPFNFPIMFGNPPRNVKQVDSSLIDLPQLLSCTDTLSIKKLILFGLELKEVPSAIYRFPNLEDLNLGFNELTSVKIDLKKLPKLKKLDLQKNSITNKSLSLTKNKTLKFINLKENKLTTIPPAVKNCKRLYSLLLAGNELADLNGASFKHLSSLVDLNLYKTGITSLPRQVSKIRKLEVLDLYHNKLTGLPKSIVKLRKLTHLAISHNEINNLPSNLHKLKRLHTIYAHHNRLSQLPDKINELPALKILDLGYNWFTNFPIQLTKFRKLEELNLTSNNFTEFPEELLKIGKVEKLYIWGNPFLTNTGEAQYASQLNALKAKNIEVFH